MRRKPNGRSANNSRNSPFGSGAFNVASIAILAGVLILGIGLGLAFSSAASSSSGNNVASREFIDTRAPNPEICVQNGASAMVMDTRLFVTLNPFNVYISQPSMRPGCVLRTNNWQVLERQGLIKSDRVRECKNRLNTFGFTGDLNSKDLEVDCIYQNDAAENFFQNSPGAVSPNIETERF